MSYKSWNPSWRFFELKFSGSFYFHGYDEIFADVCFTHIDPNFIRFQSLSLYHSPTRGRPPLKHRTHAHKTSMLRCTRFYWTSEGSHRIPYGSVLHFRSSCSWKLLIFFPLNFVDKWTHPVLCQQVESLPGITLCSNWQLWSLIFPSVPRK